MVVYGQLRMFANHIRFNNNKIKIQSVLACVQRILKHQYKKLEENQIEKTK